MKSRRNAIAIALLLVAALIGAYFAFWRTDPPSTFGQFEGDVATTWLDDDGQSMRLDRDFTYIDANGRRWDAPKDSIINGASIPRILWSVAGSPFTGNYRKASVVHDVACEKRTATWEEAHQMFHDACRCEGLSATTAKLFYWAVLNGGPKWSAPGEMHGFALAAPPKEIDAEMWERASKYIEENDPTLEEIATMSDAGGPLDPATPQ